MSSVIIAGDTSGTVTLDAPAVAGTTVLTLPATSGTVLTSASPSSSLPSSINGPAFNAQVNGTQSLSANVATKLNFSIEDFDTNNCFDTATYRFTPNVAGYYQFIVQTYGQATTGFSTARLYKNGSVEKEGVLGIPVAGVGTICSVVALIYMNGTTDYIEAYGYQSVNTTIQGTGSVTFFSGSMVRGA